MRDGNKRHDERANLCSIWCSLRESLHITWEKSKTEPEVLVTEKEESKQAKVQELSHNIYHSPNSKVIPIPDSQSSHLSPPSPASSSIPPEPE